MSSLKKGRAGEKIEDILRSTLRVLCSSAVPYGSEISIDALIGITVDSSEVILVNIHEQLDKSGNHLSGDDLNFGNCASQQSVKSEPIDNAVISGLQQQHDNYTATAADSSGYTVSDYATSETHEFNSCGQPFGDVIDIAECDDYDEQGYDQNCDMEEGQYVDSFPDDQTGEFGDEYFADFDVGMTHDGGDGGVVGGMYSGDVKPVNLMPASQVGGYYHETYKAITVASPRGQRRGAAQMTVVRRTQSKPVTPRRQLKANVKDEIIDSGETSTIASAVTPHSQGISANEKTTVYTCSYCGKMIRHATTFQRHKLQHEGVVYRCDLCGAVLSRRDVLTVHRRKCEAKMKQQQQSSSSQSFDAM